MQQRSRITRQRARRPALMVLALVLSVIPSHAGADVVYPTIAGTTVIHAHGSSGITLMVPQSTTVGQSFSLSLEGATVVDAEFQNQDGPIPGLCHLCTMGEVIEFADDGFGPQTLSCYDDSENNIGCPLHAGLVNVYIIANGAFTLTVGFPGLTGHTELTATGQIHSILEQLPLTCPTGDCDKIAYGGVAHEVGLADPGVEWTYGFFRVPNYIPGTDIPPGSGGIPNSAVSDIEACTYPGLSHSGASPDPQDHPLGCDPIVSPSDHADPLTGINNRGSCIPACTAIGVGDANMNAQGLIYAGIRLEKVEAIPNGPPEGWAAWLDPGIACPSGDFNQCG